ncbi:uncharacterized protein MELLADRAFT_58753 [Melampsora larici-populina 98AG31]|uniref:Uncharacterized protein n=1 Tax=Melampsora larici-populina (strain 98AG31 / pathotype 3-4-7) TaxID=747676 RepID=F4R4Q4_MELLP|nr:uncharacterized protein MELLADRAFT_58753 [Melampsora larici-populina 98AG31]EGG12849.1 hypothetical protein MELLADRAFT_58753 [Melampsora larici-populina 98AG31]
MAITQTNSRSTRRARGDVAPEGATVIDPPSSNGPENNQLGELEGTDDPELERLDGEAIQEHMRDEIARSMDSQGIEDMEEGEGDGDDKGDGEDEDDQDQDFNELEALEEYGRDSSSNSSSTSSNSSSDSSGSSESDSSGSDSSESEDSNSSSDSDSDGTVRKGTGKNESIKDLKQRLKKAIRAKDEAKSKLAREKNPTKGKEVVNKHGKKKNLSKVKSSSSLKKSITKENGIRFQERAPCKSTLPPLQTYWGEAMKNLSESVPLTVLNPTFVRKDKEECRRNQPSSSSLKSRNRGLTPPSEYAMTFREWIDGISLLRKYLKKSYNFVQIAKQLKTHVKHVKDIKYSTESWMVALRYDIMLREQLFGHQAKGVSVPDASIYVEKFEKMAREKASMRGELTFGDNNPYAKGARFENRDPETGIWNELPFRHKDGYLGNPEDLAYQTLWKCSHHCDNNNRWQAVVGEERTEEEEERVMADLELASIPMSPPPLRATTAMIIARTPAVFETFLLSSVFLLPF